MIRQPMTSQLRPADLPDFEKPPVGEVALSLQFSRLKLTNIHGGLLWMEFRDKYPVYEEHPPLAPAFEVFGPNPAGLVANQLEFLAGVPDIRFWFVTQDQSGLLQFQPDRLVHNWRLRDGAVYPRYEAIKAEFADEYKTFERFVKAGQLGEVKPNQCEVIYINHIEMPDGSDPRSNPQRLLSFWGKSPTAADLPKLEDVGLQMRYLMEREGQNMGRLYAQVSPGFRRRDMKPVLQLTLTARGKPAAESIEAAFEFFDLGRAAIVRGFKALTTTEMHEVWGLK